MSRLDQSRAASYRAILRSPVAAESLARIHLVLFPPALGGFRADAVPEGEGQAKHPADLLTEITEILQDAEDD